MELVIKKEDVYKEVAKTTNYTAAKMDDPNAYERIFTTDENREMLERFWDECKNIVSGSLKKFFVSEEETEQGVYILTLRLSQSFDDSQTDSMQRSLFSFFVMNITAKWYTFANKSEAAAYATEAATYIEDVKQKAFYKKRPERPIYD